MWEYVGDVLCLKEYFSLSCCFASVYLLYCFNLQQNEY